MGMATLKVSEVDWGRYGTNDIDAAVQFIWSKKLGVPVNKIKHKLKGDLIEITVDGKEAPDIKKGVRK